MLGRVPVLVAAALVAACAPPPPAAPPGAVRSVAGVVFEDEDGDGQRDPGESGVAGVAVSNGLDIVRTDRQGRYRIPFGTPEREDAVLFVIKPSGWMTPVDENQLPRFAYVHRPLGAPPGLGGAELGPTGPMPASLDFALVRREEPKHFRMILFGDTQPYTQAEVDLLAHDVVEELMGVEALFGLTLGDLVGDDLSLFGPLNQVVGRLGIPWYNVIGNHDLDFASPDDAWSAETFTRMYGPPAYAFEVGPVHFVVLDDVVYHGANPVDGTPGGYAAGIGARQLAFVERYLAEVPRDRLVVLAMHIPLVGKPPRSAPERRRLLELLSGHPRTLSLAAHTHFQRHAFFGPKHGYTAGGKHHHLVHATTSGSWWQGEPDEVGIPHATMRCGAPNGYSIVTFDGDGYDVRFRAARRPDSYQMNVFAPEEVAAADAAGTEVLVNVFAGSERSVVEMRLDDGPWQALEHTPRKDPYYAATLRREAARPRENGRGLPPVIDSPHVWVGTLPADPMPGTRVIEVRTTDMFGRTDVAHRLLRVR